MADSALPTTPPTSYPTHKDNISKIEQAHTEIKNFVESINGASASNNVKTLVTTTSDKVDDGRIKIQTVVDTKVTGGINDIMNVLKDNANEEYYNNLASTTVATVEAITKSIQLFQSGDPTKITMGALDILVQVSQFASLLGPQGVIIAAIAGPLCTIVSSLLGITLDPPESQEAMLKRVIEEALDEHEEDDLMSTALGVKAILIGKLRTVKLFFEMSDMIGDNDKDYITDVSYTEVASEFLGKLSYYIKDGISADDAMKAGRTANFILAYAHIAYYRCQLLSMLSALYKADGKAQVSAESARLKGIAQKAECIELLNFLYERPTDKNHMTYAKVRSLSRASLDIIEGICGSEAKRLPGTVMSIYNLLHRRYMTCLYDESITGDRVHTKEVVTPNLLDKYKFIVYDNETDSTIEIFSLSSAGYVYGNDTVYNSNHSVRSRKPLKLGGQNAGGKWTVAINDKRIFDKNDECVECVRNGKVFVRNEYQKEYMFSSSSADKKVWNLGGGETIDKGNWLFREIYTPLSIKYIKNAGNDLMIRGRDNFDNVNTIWVKSPTHYNDRKDLYHWEFIKCADNNYNIKSYSSEGFIEARSTTDVYDQSMTYEAANKNDLFKWELEKHSYNGKERYAIRSVSNRYYLSGRSIFGPIISLPVLKLHLVDVAPNRDPHVLWDIDEVA